MSVDIKGTLSNYLTNGGTAIDIPPAIQNVFGTAIGTVISEIFSGSVQIGGANFTFTGDENSATITGTGSNPPLLPSVSATFTFTVENSGASMSLDATVVSNFTLSQAWPSELNEAPFNNLVITGGTFGLDVNFGDSSFLLTVTVSGSNFEGSTLGTGLLEVQYTGELARIPRRPDRRGDVDAIRSLGAASKPHFHRGRRIPIDDYRFRPERFRRTQADLHSAQYLTGTHFLRGALFRRGYRRSGAIFASRKHTGLDRHVRQRRHFARRHPQRTP